MTLFALLICLSNNCVNHDMRYDFVLSREACIEKAWELRTLSKQGTRTVCVSDGNGEIIDSAGRLARGWQHRLSD